MPVTGCNYGVHPFAPIESTLPWLDAQMHMHECPLCGAVYIERGASDCFRCAPRGST